MKPFHCGSISALVGGSQSALKVLPNCWRQRDVQPISGLRRRVGGRTGGLLCICLLREPLTEMRRGEYGIDHQRGCYV